MAPWRSSKLVILIALCLVSPGILQGDDKGKPSPITIGGIFCLTGEIASGCNAIREGAEVALDLVNDSGGINGHPLHLDIQDSHFIPKNSHTLANRFVSDPNVLVVLITGIVETKAAAAPLERAKMSYLTLWDSAPAIERLGDYSFGIGPWLPSTYEVSAEFAFNHLKARTAAVVSSAQEWSLEVGKGFIEHFKALGGSVVSYQETLPSDSDFRTVLSRVIDARPEVVYAPVTAHLIPFFRQIRQLGFKGPIITSDNLTDELISQSSGVFEGAFQSMVADPETEEAQRLKVLYRRKFGREATMLAFHGWGYDGVRLAAEALRRSNLKRESVRDALLSLKNFPGAGGAITFSSEGSWRMPLKIFKIDSGKFKLVQ